MAISKETKETEKELLSAIKKVTGSKKTATKKTATKKTVRKVAVKKPNSKTAPIPDFNETHFKDEKESLSEKSDSKDANSQKSKTDSDELLKDFKRVAEKSFAELGRVLEDGTIFTAKCVSAIGIKAHREAKDFEKKAHVWVDKHPLASTVASSVAVVAATKMVKNIFKRK